jgi:hypothetical protein
VRCHSPGPRRAGRRARDRPAPRRCPAAGDEEETGGGGPGLRHVPDRGFRGRPGHRRHRDLRRAVAEAGARPQRLLRASTSTKDLGLPDTYYQGRLAAPGTIDTVWERRCSHSPITAALTSASSGTTRRRTDHRGDGRHRDRRRHPRRTSPAPGCGQVRRGLGRAPRCDRGEGRQARVSRQSLSLAVLKEVMRSARGTATCSAVPVRDHTGGSAATTRREAAAE